MVSLVAQFGEAVGALAEMIAEVAPRSRLVAIADRGEDRVVLATHAGGMPLTFGRCHAIEASPLPGYHGAAECIEQPCIVGVLRGNEDGAMKREIFLGTGETGFDGGVESIEPALHPDDIVIDTPK